MSAQSFEIYVKPRDQQSLENIAQLFQLLEDENLSKIKEMDKHNRLEDIEDIEDFCMNIESGSDDGFIFLTVMPPYLLKIVS